MPRRAGRCGRVGGSAATGAPGARGRRARDCGAGSKIPRVRQSGRRMRPSRGSAAMRARVSGSARKARSCEAAAVASGTGASSQPRRRGRSGALRARAGRGGFARARRRGAGGEAGEAGDSALQAGPEQDGQSVRIGEGRAGPRRFAHERPVSAAPGDCGAEGVEDGGEADGQVHAEQKTMDGRGWAIAFSPHRLCDREHFLLCQIPIRSQRPLRTRGLRGHRRGRGPWCRMRERATRLTRVWGGRCWTWKLCFNDLCGTGRFAPEFVLSADRCRFMNDAWV